MARLPTMWIDWLRMPILTGALAIVSCSTPQVEAPRTQGWTAAEQSWWYEGKQGSRLMPYGWMKALEQPEGGKPFLDSAYMASLGFLPRQTSFGADLPVGFALDDNDDSAFRVTKLRWYGGQKPTEKWIGLNCSACHTGEVSFDGKPVRIDGGPSLVDFQSFVEAIDLSLRRTHDDEQRFGRFTTKVLGDKDTPDNRALLRTALAGLIAWEDRVERQNATPLRYGYARVDAFGHIYNKVALYTQAADPIANPSDAPVSYPFLWGIARHDKLQWNGIAASARIKLGGDKYLDYGAMGRNAGEVIGVFGEVMTVKGEPFAGYKSSIWADNLDRLEKQLAHLTPPKWPGPIDAALLPAGKQLYQAHCEGCHAIAPTDASHDVIAIKMIPFSTTSAANQTDPWMACNAFTYQAKTGVLEGTKTDYVKGEPLQPIAPLATLLPTTVKGALIGKKGEIIKAAASSFLGMTNPPRVVTEAGITQQTREQRRNFCLQNKDPLLAYKARPLEGVWATAPYLHNGSVPSLYDLLLPAAQRPKCFDVGSRTYDAKTVGYVFDRTIRCARRDAVPAGLFRFYVDDESNRPIDGNSNSGHDYGAAAMSEADRRALLEYMKTL